MLPYCEVPQINLNLRLSTECMLDVMQLEQCGLIRITGWSSPAARPSLEQLVLVVNKRSLPFLCAYSYLRPDVVRLAGPDNLWDFGIEYIFAEEAIDSLEIRLPTGCVFRKHGLNFPIRNPHYGGLRGVREVLGRDQIYGSGPPSKEVSDEVKRITAHLSGSVLDFGCGAGALVTYFRSRGIEAQGIELERLRNHVCDEVLPYVRFYDGSSTLPYDDKSFDHVSCIEVLEHVEGYETAVTEIARVARRSAVFTVPDISAIPLLHKHNVVPWHLLELTHVNFFTQLSLDRLLRRSFCNVTFARSGSGSINGTLYWTGLVAFASSHSVGSSVATECRPFPLSFGVF